MASYMNTAFSMSMLPEGCAGINLVEISAEKAAEMVVDRRGYINNVCNPNHANTLAAVSQVLGVDVASDATGDRVSLEEGDELIVFQLNPFNLPRETREYTDEEIEAAELRFFYVMI